MARIGIIGSGTWGTALALLLTDNGHQLTVWSKLPEEIEYFKEHHENEKLPGVVLPDSVVFTTDLEEAVKDQDLLVLATPSVFSRATAKAMKPFVKEGQIITSVSKGIEESSLKTLSEQIEEELPQAVVTVLSGPSHAEEVGKRIPTSVVVGARSEGVAKKVQDIFMSPVFRVYISPDMTGIELGAALKNVIALAAGIADGIGYGDNTKAALITRGMAEIVRLGIQMGGSPHTFYGLSGMGDLIVTCASLHSRNRRAGILIGQGYTMEEAMNTVNQIVEGVYSAKAALGLAEKYNVSMPIVECVNEVLFNGLDPKSAVGVLMMRDKVAENTLVPWEE
ncbi:MAG: NAD(P)-dependent glycerol-3-phosphate dehydrogenase [Lachnospiraceae bacterium]|nr:NAD(P)-dependent glycerol-3-phosphate dehydrogenase [Lachnospiraceae bacterium]